LEKRGGGLFAPTRSPDPLVSSPSICPYRLSVTNGRRIYCPSGETDVHGEESLETKRKVLEHSPTGISIRIPNITLEMSKAGSGILEKSLCDDRSGGMNEACLNLLEKNIGSPEGQTFAHHVLDS